MSEKDKPSPEGTPRAPEGSPTQSPAAEQGSQPSNPPPSPPSESPRAGAEHQPPAAKPPEKPAAPPPPARGAKPEPKHPGFVTVTVDGKEVVAKPGTNMIEAAKQVGTEIPYYCYHKNLSIAANCRMCLVQVSNAPKLVPACQTPLQEGQEITTDNARVKDTQRGVMEMLLLNHPVDCAICDQAGECKLQDYYMRYDHKPSRLEGPKVLKNKRKVLGPTVVLDQERCILCTRCVRFMSEVAKEPQLGVFGRGSHEVIDTFPGDQLDSNYSVNTVDICPVGALLNRDTRFQARSWFLSTSPSICTGCSRGCSTFVDYYGQDTYRYRPRENTAVNDTWMCDTGRLTYKELNLGRAQVPYVGRGEDRREDTAAEVARLTAEKLAPLAKAKGEGIAVLASAVASNEELLACLGLAKESLGVGKIYVGGRPDGEADHFLMTADKNPNRKGLGWIAGGLGLTAEPFSALRDALRAKKVKALWIVGGELPVDEETFAAELDGVELLVVQTAHEGPLATRADFLLPAAMHVETEGSFVQQDGVIQRVRQAYPARGEARPHWQWAAELGKALGLAEVHKSAREVFKAWAPKVAELADFDWDRSAPPARQARGRLAMPAAADGRPPGWRESGAPRVRGI